MLFRSNQVEVTAAKDSRRSDLNSVSVQVVQEDGNVTVCAVYPTPERWYSRRSSRNGRNDEPNECRPGSAGHMEEAERLADRIVVIDHGRVVADDTLSGMQRLVPAGVAGERVSLEAVFLSLTGRSLRD